MLSEGFGYPIEADGITYETPPSIIRKWNEGTVSLSEVIEVLKSWGLIAVLNLGRTVGVTLPLCRGPLAFHHGLAQDHRWA